MKTLFSISLMLLSMYVVAQNVGINNPNPQYPLDVQGNVNVAGNVLLNGNSGSNGQVIVSKGGTTTWAGIGDYKTVLSFVESATFTVPAGVTEILIEAWGGGGGGSAGGGGGAGMYIYTTITITPGELLDLYVGGGGAGSTSGNTGGSNGSPAIISKGAVNILRAEGGRGAGSLTPGISIYESTNGSFMQFAGEGGKANEVSYQQKNSTLYTIITKYGAGGAAGPDYSRFSEGYTKITNEANGVTILNGYPTTFAPFPASGGGGGTFGLKGANGYIVLHY